VVSNKERGEGGNYQGLPLRTSGNIKKHGPNTLSTVANRRNKSQGLMGDTKIKGKGGRLEKKGSRKSTRRESNGNFEEGKVVREKLGDRLKDGSFNQKIGKQKGKRGGRGRWKGVLTKDSKRKSYREKTVSERETTLKIAGMGNV